MRVKNLGSKRYIWSKAYPLDGAYTEPSLVEQVALDVTMAMAHSQTSPPPAPEY